mgnify:CR=1 FL=1
MSRKSLPVILTDAEITRLEQWIRAGSTPQQVVLRARIIVAAARGQTDQQIAQELKVQRRTTALWRRRGREQGIGCVWEIGPGRGRKAHYSAAQVARIVEATLQTQPAGSTLGAPARGQTLKVSARTRSIGSGRNISSIRI